jgi:hypothetical protein
MKETLERNPFISKNPSLCPKVSMFLTASIPGDKIKNNVIVGVASL